MPETKVSETIMPEKQAKLEKSVKQFPEPCVGALIFNKDNKIFLVKSHKFRNKYVIVGGHIELGEKAEDALKREVKEETGLDIYDIKFSYFQEFIFDEIFWKKKHFVFFDYICKTNSTKVMLNEEAQEYVWVTIDEALKLDLEPYTRNTIEYYTKSTKC